MKRSIHLTGWPLVLSMIAAALIGAADSVPADHHDAKKIVLIPTKQDHPRGTHMYRHECKLLAACLNNHDGVEATVSPQNGWPKDPAMLNDADCIVYYAGPAGDIVLSEAHREQFEKLLDKGVGYAAIHWATDANMKHGPRYREVLGGWFNTEFSDIETTEAQLSRPNPDHPICRGWEPFKHVDEYYLNLKFHQNMTPIVNVDLGGGTHTVAWAFEREDGGRSFGTVMGHFHENFQNPAFRRAMTNGLLWAANVEIPESGADVEVTEKRLKLPPKK